VCSSVVSVACCVGRGLCDVLITRPEESYRMCVLIVCHVGSKKTWPKSYLGLLVHRKEKCNY
jgi:hypothetical protein